jgi:hypothetical protein
VFGNEVFCAFNIFFFRFTSSHDRHRWFYGTKEMVDMDNLVKQVVERDINAYQNNLIYIDGLQGPVRRILVL